MTTLESISVLYVALSVGAIIACVLGALLINKASKR
jgi:hypothetical protein